jgi:hypothetical protein
VEKKQLWFNLNYYTGFCLELLRTIMSIIVQDTLYTGLLACYNLPKIKFDEDFKVIFHVGFKSLPGQMNSVKILC